MNYSLIRTEGNQKLYRVELNNEPCAWVEFVFIDGQYPSWVIGDYAPGFDPYPKDEALYEQVAAFRDRAKQVCQAVYNSLLPSNYDQDAAAAHWLKAREIADRGIEAAERV